MDKQLRKIEINAIRKINRALALELKGNIFEQIVKETVQEAIDYAHSCEQFVCDHPNEEWVYDESGVDMYCKKCESKKEAN